MTAKTPAEVGAECFAEDLKTTGEAAADLRSEDWWDGNDVNRVLRDAGIEVTDPSMSAWFDGYKACVTKAQSCGAYSTPEAPCPYCSEPCEADWVDVGVGMVQCGPYHCCGCGASEMGPEARDLGFADIISTGPKGRAKVTDDPDELRTGWYKSRVSPLANTAGGVLVDHKTAAGLYRMGLLDDNGGPA